MNRGVATPHRRGVSPVSKRRRSSWLAIREGHAEHSLIEAPFGHTLAVEHAWQGNLALVWSDADKELALAMLDVHVLLADEGKVELELVGVADLANALRDRVIEDLRGVAVAVDGLAHLRERVEPDDLVVEKLGLQRRDRRE